MKTTLTKNQKKHKPLRILTVSVQGQGANDYAFVRSFQRAGHSVRVVPAANYIPLWENRALRAIRKISLPLLVAEYNQVLLREARQLQPDLFFVFKGQYVTPETMQAIKATGAIAIQFYPDTGFSDHGSYLPKTIGLYDWVFTTKPAGVDDLKKNYAFETASFIPHAFDPEVHTPVYLVEDDKNKYRCDVSFIGNISSKKQQFIEYLCQKLPKINLNIWGSSNWGSVPSLARYFKGSEVWGLEYAKAIQASKINLGLLFEGGKSAAEGDLITARTFEIPAVGGFMLHERTNEAMKYFKEGKECAFYDDPNDLADKIQYYLKHDDERQAIAKAGRKRCFSSGYSVDNRVEAVLTKYEMLRIAQKKKD